MNLTEIIGRILGLQQAQVIERTEPSLAAPWAHDAPAWLFFGCLALGGLAVLFYARYQRRRHAGVRAVLAVFRALALSLLLLLLAEPILTVTVSSRLRPALWLLIDGTDSMAIADDLSEAERTELAEAVGLKGEGGRRKGERRIEYVKALMQKQDDNLLEKLQEKFRLRAFLFERPDGVRSLELSAEGRPGVDGKHLAEQLTTDGQMSALGAALGDLARRHATANLAGLVILSDFNQNAGPPATAAAKQLGVKIYTVGVGATAAIDVAVGIQAPLILKKDERATVTVSLRQQGLDGQDVTVVLSARPLPRGGDPGSQPVPIAEKSISLSGAVETVDFPYVPEKTGRFKLVVEVQPAPGEVVTENNRAEREVSIRDDFLRLLFVEYEPSWEWRFIKEVFHRDKLVGMEGFRTFLQSSDPRVRQSQQMFLPTLNQPRSEFFAHDVIFLGDVPASMLSGRFCEMTEEFVRNFGGGLVVLAGPRFGPGELADTPLAALLPVKIDTGARINDKQLFELRLAPAAMQFDFMQLGADLRQTQQAWRGLGLLPWYQPVERLHPLATALAEHPTETTTDGKTRQPLIAIRRYGRGEVIYLGFNETWRLRRKYGEHYYRQFWGQMIHRLGLSHALGSQKRFVLRTDRRRYQADEQVLLRVEAYDADFQPLSEEDLPDRKLHAELILPPQSVPAAQGIQPLGISQLRKGVFEARFPVFVGGEHRLRVTDPITDKPVEITFQVASLPVERQRAVRNVALQEAIAIETGGVSYGLRSVGELAEAIKLTPKTETTIEVIPLWNTWLCFGCLVFLLLGEWLLRKRVNLP